MFLTTCAACHGENAKGNREVGRSEPDRCLLDLRRRPRHHHRLRAWRTAGPHADMGRAADDGRNQDPRALRPRSRDAAAMSGRARARLPGGWLRLAAGSGGAAAVRGRQRASRLRGVPVAAGLRRAPEGRGRRRRLPRRQVRLLKEKVMGETDKSYGLLSETSGIGETRDPRLQRHLPLLEGLRWLSAGWRDFWTRPASSLAYGVGVFAAFGRLHLDARRVRARLHPLPRACRLPDRRAVPGDRALREEPRHRRRQGDRASLRCFMCAREPARRSSSQACSSAS